jgi:hypothetical protein
LYSPNSKGAATRIQETCAGDHLQAIEYISTLAVQAPNKRKEFLEKQILFLKRYLSWYCLPYLEDDGWLDRKLILNYVLQDIVFIGEEENSDKSTTPIAQLRQLSNRYLQFGRQSSKRIYLYGLSVIAISLVELFKKNGLTIHCIVDDNIDEGVYREIPLIKFQHIYKSELELKEKDTEKVMLVTQFDSNVALRLANRVNRSWGERFQSIWILDDSFSIRKLNESLVPLQ